MTLNRYAYAVNNPIMYSDPSGHRIMPLAASYEEAYSDNTRPLLQNGDTGDSVVDLQNRLMNLGYTLNGGADGKFGSSTESAVRAFQESKNLSMKDGIVGNETWGALLSGSSSASSGAASSGSSGLLRMGSSGDAVTKLQQTLMGLGYHLDKYGADGVFGQETYDAVRAFQDHSEIEVDGIVGNQTWAALAAASRPNATSQNGCGTSEHIGNGDYDYKTGNVQGTSNTNYPNLYVNGHYDRAAAVAYATNPNYSSQDKNGKSLFDWEKHTRNYNHEYERYDSYDYYLLGHASGSDCANFVSQSLFAGGVKQTDAFYFRWFTLELPMGISKTPEASSSWIRPESQLQYLKDAGYVNGDVIEVNSPDEANEDIEKYNVQVGDLIYLKNSSEGLHHAMMITKIDNGKIFISAHSNDHINSEYDSNFFQDGNIGVIVRMK